MAITELTFQPRLPGFAALAQQPRAALLIVHGLAEYAGRYRVLAEDLASRGISCFAFDQRGHGATSGPRTHVARFQHFIDDLHGVVAEVQARDPRLPLYVWGHSMGAMVVAAAAPSLRVRGAIISSNSLEVFRRSPNPLGLPFRLLSCVAPRMRVPLGLDPRKISSDEAVQRAYGSDPLIPHTASLRLIVEFAAACERIRTSAREVRMPCLVLHGELDAIAPAAAAQQLFDALGAQDKQLVLFEGQRHELHNERSPVRARFIDTIEQWILQRAHA